MGEQGGLSCLRILRSLLARPLNGGAVWRGGARYRHRAAPVVGRAGCGPRPLIPPRSARREQRSLN